MSYQVIIKPSGHTFDVRQGETVLQAAMRVGFSLPFSCRNGSCGTCKGKIIAGKVNFGQYDKETLTEKEKEAGNILFCCAMPLSNLTIECREIRVTAEIEIKIMPCRVHKLERAAPDVMIVSLKIPANQKLKFVAGQYIDILLKDDKRRSFSLANAPCNDSFLQLHARNYPGGVFAKHVFTEMKERDILRFEGPFGSFYLRDTLASNTPIIFVASGTGFAPVKSILEQAFHEKNKSILKNKVTFYWGVRTRDDLYMAELAKQWQNCYENFTFVPVLSDAVPTDKWHGRNGLVHQAVLHDFDSLARHQVYACGSPLMVKAAFADFTQLRNLPEDQFFSDIFTPSAGQEKR